MNNTYRVVATGERDKSADSIARAHSAHLERNRTLALSGVVSVPVFNEREVQVTLSDRKLTVQGADLEITKLDLESGVLALEGSLSSLRYSSAKRQPLWRRTLARFKR